MIEFAVEDGLDGAWDQPRIETLVGNIVHTERGPGAYALALHLVGDDTIRALNREHRGLDAPTDVLSFPLTGTPFVLPPDQPANLGDVVVSYPRAVAQASDFGHSVEREMAYLVAHGVLHVLGYDHEAPQEQVVMRQKEEEALEPLGFTR
jgi:probable rRNA maturation factor